MLNLRYKTAIKLTSGFTDGFDEFDSIWLLYVRYALYDFV